jgi:hypothetical protein
MNQELVKNLKTILERAALFLEHEMVNKIPFAGSPKNTANQCRLLIAELEKEAA